MPTSDWRTPAAYDHVQNISAAGFAWEFIRRDPDYRRDFREMITSPHGATEVRTAFANRWGLRFRGRSRPACRRRSGFLDARRAA